jgi:hypothetical protein
VHNEAFHDLCPSLDIIRVITSRIRWKEYVACMGEMRNAYQSLVEKRERKRLLGNPGHTWEENIFRGIREIG